MVRKLWYIILQTPHPSDSKGLLDNHTTITEKEVLAVKLTRITVDYNTIRNKFITALRSLGTNLKWAMQVHRKNLGDDGPVFL